MKNREGTTSSTGTLQAEASLPGLNIWPPLLIFFLFTASVGATGYFVYRATARGARQSAENALSAVADLKASQVGGWISERRANADRARESPFMGPETEGWLARGAPPGDQTAERLYGRLTGFHVTHGWSRVYLIDPQGGVRIEMSGGRPASRETRARALEAIATRQVIFRDIERDPSGGPQATSLAFFAPLLVREGKTEKAVAAIAMETDPASQLLAFVESWPLPSRTGESLLVRREGNSVVYINELRHHPGSRLRFRRPLDSPGFVAAKAVRGERGPMAGVDYRQVPVLACARPVPGSPWFLIAKVDMAEVNGPIVNLARMVALFVLALVLAVGFATWVWLREQHTAALLRFANAERERAVLARHVDYLTRYANDIILLMDDEGRILDANDRAVAAYGYDRETLIGMHVRSLRADESMDTFERDWARAAVSDGIVFETMHKRGDGTTFPVEISSRAIKVEGVCVRQSIVRDLTERHEAEGKIVKLSNLLTAAIEQATDAVIVTDRDGCIEYVNPAFEKASGYQLAEVVGDKPRILKSGMHEEEMYRSLWKQLSAGLPWSGDFVNRRKDGSTYEVEASISPIFTAAKEISGFVALQHDRTEHIALLERVHRAEEMERVGRLTSGVAHEVRNPLNAIQAAVSTLAMELPDTEDNRQLLAAVHSQVGRLVNLMRELLDFSKPIEHARVEPFSVDALCAEAVELWRSSNPDQRPDRVRVEPCGHDDVVEVDPGRMHQVLVNLLDNAHQHTPAHGDIVFRVKREKGKVRIQVVDSGTGVQPEHLGKVFDPFFTTRRRGTGLGLSLVKNIVEQHGGNVVLRNNESGPGCTAEVILPARHAVAESEHASETVAR